MARRPRADAPTPKGPDFIGPIKPGRMKRAGMAIMRGRNKIAGKFAGAQKMDEPSGAPNVPSVGYKETRQSVLPTNFTGDDENGTY